MTNKIPAWLINLWPALGQAGTANYRLGCDFLEQGKLKDALFRFKLCVWFDPNHADGWAKLGEAHLKTGDRTKAKSALKEALRLRPGHPQATAIMHTLSA